MGIAGAVRAALACAAALTLPVGGAEAQDPDESGWISLFNGRNLSGWTPKIRGHDLGVDPYRTFRVEDGLLTVGYEGYEGEFDERFGHLFFQEPYSHYRLLIEYRFTGAQTLGGPGWALRNSGVMFHSQSPESMDRNQDFPISLEAQFLGGNGVDPRSTANLCTPGTHVDIDGVRVEEHCVQASAPTFHGDVWVTVELEVLGDSLITHLVDGEPVLSYTGPVVGGGSVSHWGGWADRRGDPLEAGYLALQSESHPIQFRKVLLKPVEPTG